MKKIFAGLLISCVILFAGCEKVEEVTGDYKEGTYVSHLEEDYNGQTNTISAVVYVGSDGKIKSVYIDSTYRKQYYADMEGTKIDTPSEEAVEGVDYQIIYYATSKKALGNEYGMKNTSANIGKIPGGGEWFEQIENLEKKIVTEQGLSWLTWTDTEQTTTDSVSGVTMKIGSMYKAVNEALTKAKK